MGSTALVHATHMAHVGAKAPLFPHPPARGTEAASMPRCLSAAGRGLVVCHSLAAVRLTRMTRVAKLGLGTTSFCHAPRTPKTRTRICQTHWSFRPGPVPSVGRIPCFSFRGRHSRPATSPVVRGRPNGTGFAYPHHKHYLTRHS